MQASSDTDTCKGVQVCLCVRICVCVRIYRCTPQSQEHPWGDENTLTAWQTAQEFKQFLLQVLDASNLQLTMTGRYCEWLLKLRTLPRAVLTKPGGALHSAGKCLPVISAAETDEDGLTFAFS